MSSVLFSAVQLSIMSAPENWTSLLFCRVLFVLLCYWCKIFTVESLQRFKEETTFDPKCKVIVVRRMIEQSHDYRFNPLLMKGCHVDISKFCSGVVAQEPQDKELEGKVIKCLKVRIFLLVTLLCVSSWLCAAGMCAVKSAPNFSGSMIFTVL